MLQIVAIRVEFSMDAILTHGSYRVFHGGAEVLYEILKKI